MTDEIVFYTNPMSRGRIVRWMLEEMGVPYRTEVVEYGPAMKAPAFLAINPMGKVPALTHRGAVVTETSAICAYLADAFPDCGLAPAPASPLRASYYRWMFFAAGPIEAAVTIKASGLEIPAEKERMAGFGTMATMLDVLEHAVTGCCFLVGDRFGSADVLVSMQLGWGMQFGTIERRAAFEAYAGPLMDRAAAKRARAIDDALLPPR